MLALAPPTLADTPVVAHHGTAAWWSSDHGRHIVLTVWRGHGRPRIVARAKPGPIGRRDLDLGPGPDGATWATYTHCLPGGCRPWAVDLRTGAQHDLGVGRGRAPSIWRHLVVFVREGRLYRARIGEPSSARRVPTPRGEDVEAVDLRGDGVAYTTWESGEDPRSQGVFLENVHGPAPRRPVAGGGVGEECSRLLRSPVLGRNGLSWLRAGAGDPTVCQASTPTRFTRTPDGAIRRRRLPTGTLAAAVVRGRTLVLAPPPAKAHRFDRDLCHLGAPGGCEVRTL
jgi:hypothetical protein